MNLEHILWGNWAFGGSGIYFIARERTSPSGFILRFFNLGAGTFRDVMAVPHTPALYDSGLAVSPDGRWILFAQVDAGGSDIVIADGLH